MMAMMQGNINDNKLLPEGRLSGPMPWVIAIIIFLTVLAAAAALSLTNAANSIGRDISGRVSIQVINANVESRALQVRSIKQLLDTNSLVRSVRPVDDVQLAGMMERWLGQDAQDLGLPMPALIDVDLVGDASTASVAKIRQAIAPVAPDARLFPHSTWLAPVAKLIDSFAILSIGLMLLLAVASAAVVMLTARSALNVNRATIELLHLIGATDTQIARLFQRRIALDVGFGSIIGGLLALIIMFLLREQFRDLGAALMEHANLGWGWLVILGVPLALIAIASITARLTITSALRKIL